VTDNDNRETDPPVPLFDASGRLVGSPPSAPDDTDPYCSCALGDYERAAAATGKRALFRPDIGHSTCNSTGLKQPAPPPRDLWPTLIAGFDAFVTVEGVDVRQSAVLRRTKAIALDMLRRRAAERGALHATTANADFSRLADDVMDAMGATLALMQHTPRTHREQVQRVLQSLGLVLVQLATLAKQGEGVKDG
jgi:hypothetical protein